MRGLTAFRHSAMDDIASRLSIAAESARFTASEVEGLPEPVRRYFLAAIEPGVALAHAATLRMRGTIKVGRWLSFRAGETLAPRHGFAWSGRVARIIGGSDHYVDGDGAMDWKLLGMRTVAHGQGGDFARSAAQRAGAEGVWVPTALLPRFGVEWSADDDTHLRARFHTGDVPVDLRCVVNERGELQTVDLQRWGDPDRTGEWGSYPFGFEATQWSRFDGVTIPSSGHVGWYHGTDRWAEGEFFRFHLTNVRLCIAG